MLCLLAPLACVRRLHSRPPVGQAVIRRQKLVGANAFAQKPLRHRKCDDCVICLLPRVKSDPLINSKAKVTNIVIEQKQVQYMSH